MDDETMGIADLWAEFWRNVESGVLRLPVCASCGAPNWYPSVTCRSCESTSFEWVRLSGGGTLFLSMTVHRDFLGTGRSLPYEVALTSPDEYPDIRLLAHVEPGCALDANEAVELGTDMYEGKRVVTVSRRAP